MKTIKDYDYELPPELIAHKPAPSRAESRLMVCEGDGREVVAFSELGRFVRSGDLLVFNDTRVMPCRLAARKASGGAVEVFVLGPLEGAWGDPVGAQGVLVEALTRSSKVLKAGAVLSVEGVEGVEVALEARGEGGVWRARLRGVSSLVDVLEEAGRTPLPPYIVKRRKVLGEAETQAQDKARYQTVYAKTPGAVAAPTAGLHFTPELLDELRAAGVELGFLTLHVGVGTFRPMGEGPLEAQSLHEEGYVISETLARQVAAARARGGRIIAVGTTSTRALEDQGVRWGCAQVQAGRWATSLFIKPGFRWRLVDGMITNFHLPRSSLMVLVGSLAGDEVIRAAYREAVSSRMRFYSYGDAMLLWRSSSPRRGEVKVQ